MKTIEEWDTNLDGDKSYDGKITSYINTTSKVMDHDTVITNLQNDFGKTIKDVNHITSYYSSKLKKIAPLVLAGTILMTCLSGCSQKKEIVKESPTPTEEVVVSTVDPTLNIDYVMPYGGNMWNLASKCYDNDADILSLSNKLAEVYPNPKPGDNININVPYSHLGNFGYEVSLVEPSEEEKMDYFINQTLSNPGDLRNKDTFQKTIDEVLKIVDSIKITNDEIFQDKQMLDFYQSSLEDESNNYKIETQKLGDNFNDTNVYNTHFASELEQIDNIKEGISTSKIAIINAYKTAIELLEKETSRKYGVDFIKPSTYIITKYPSDIKTKAYGNAS